MHQMNTYSILRVGHNHNSILRITVLVQGLNLMSFSLHSAVNHLQLLKTHKLGLSFEILEVNQQPRSRDNPGDRS